MKMMKPFFIGEIIRIAKAIKSLVVLSGMLPFLISCNADDVQLPTNRLAGIVNGEPWTYKSANAYLESTDFLYDIRFLSNEEVVNDPCALPIPTRTHVRALFRPREGSYFVNQQVVDDNDVVVFFETSPTESLRAISGFMEVYFIEGQLISGYLQAEENNENNTVEGAFEIRLCQ